MNRKLYEYSYSLKKERRRKVTVAIIFIISIFAIINLILKFLVFPVRQISDSMIPDVNSNSFTLITPLNKTPQRGDVVLVSLNNDEEKTSFIYKAANTAVKFFTAQQFHIKRTKGSFFEQNNDYELRRVLGMPGDTIYMRDYVLYVKPYDQKHFLTEFEVTPKVYNVTFYSAPDGWDTDIGVQGSFNEMVLGTDQYFVLGDNRKGASDSRLWGCIRSRNIKGCALLCYFPFADFKFF